MAATLSAEEEQVGLNSFVYTYSFLYYIAHNVPLSGSLSTWGVFWPCALRAPTAQRLAMAVRDGGFVAKWS